MSNKSRALKAGTRNGVLFNFFQKEAISWCALLKKIRLALVDDEILTKKRKKNSKKGGFCSMINDSALFIAPTTE